MTHSYESPIHIKLEPISPPATSGLTDTFQVQCQDHDMLTAAEMASYPVDSPSSWPTTTPPSAINVTTLTSSCPPSVTSMSSMSKGLKVERDEGLNDTSPGTRMALKHKIQSGRRARGQEELVVKFEAGSKSELTEMEIRKKERRKEQNRRAAQKCRVKKRALQSKAHQHCQSLYQENQGLKFTITELKAEVHKYRKVIKEHENSGQCTIVSMVDIHNKRCQPAMNRTFDSSPSSVSISPSPSPSSVLSSTPIQSSYLAPPKAAAFTLTALSEQDSINLIAKELEMTAVTQCAQSSSSCSQFPSLHSTNATDFDLIGDVISADNDHEIFQDLSGVSHLPGSVATEVMDTGNEVTDASGDVLKGISSSHRGGHYGDGGRGGNELDDILEYIQYNDTDAAIQNHGVNQLLQQQDHDKNNINSNNRHEFNAGTTPKPRGVRNLNEEFSRCTHFEVPNNSLLSSSSLSFSSDPNTTTSSCDHDLSTTSASTPPPQSSSSLNATLMMALSTTAASRTVPSFRSYPQHSTPNLISQLQSSSSSFSPSSSSELNVLTSLHHSHNNLNNINTLNNINNLNNSNIHDTSLVPTLVDTHNQLPVILDSFSSFPSTTSSSFPISPISISSVCTSPPAATSPSLLNHSPSDLNQYSPCQQAASPAVFRFPPDTRFSPSF